MGEKYLTLLKTSLLSNKVDHLQMFGYLYFLFYLYFLYLLFFILTQEYKTK